MIGAIFTAVGDAISGFTTQLTSAVGGITGMFYDATNGLTFLGSLLCLAMGIGLVYYGFKLIKSLIKTKGR